MPVVIITGASSGIGRGVAELFSKQGFKLVLAGRQEAALKEASASCELNGAEVRICVGDLVEISAAEALIATAINEFGQIDVLVNSAGKLVNGTVEDAGIEKYDDQMMVNVRSVVQLTRLAIPHLKKTNGNVVNVSSITGPCPFPGVTYYCMSKAALDQFTKCLALELAPTVRVNAVCPGVIVTNVHKRAGMDDTAYAAFLEKCKTTHALGRAGDVNEVAEAIYYLAVKASFTTGELLRVDGGRGIMHPR